LIRIDVIKIILLFIEFVIISEAPPAGAGGSFNRGAGRSPTRARRCHALIILRTATLPETIAVYSATVSRIILGFLSKQELGGSA